MIKWIKFKFTSECLFESIYILNWLKLYLLQSNIFSGNKKIVFYLNLINFLIFSLFYYPSLSLFHYLFCHYSIIFFCHYFTITNYYSTILYYYFLIFNYYLSTLYDYYLIISIFLFNYPLLLKIITLVFNFLTFLLFDFIPPTDYYYIISRVSR